MQLMLLTINVTFHSNKVEKLFLCIGPHVSVVDHAIADFLKTQELIVQACGTGSVHTVLRICTEAEISVQQKRFSNIQAS
jgi:hypothetical protein